MKYALAISACAAEVLAYGIIGALLGWRHGGGMIPMLILLGALGATWTAITGKKSFLPYGTPKDDGTSTTATPQPPSAAKKQDSIQPPRPAAPPPIAKDTNGEKEAGGAIWPITWAAVGAGVVTALGLVAAMLGVFDRTPVPQVVAPPVATSTPPVAASANAASATEKQGHIVWDDELQGERPRKGTRNDWEKLLSDATPPNQDRPASPTQRTAESPKGKWWENDPLAPSATPLSPEDLYERLAPSVVTIKVKDDYGDHIGTGSGFFVDREFVDKQYEDSGIYKSLANHLTQEEAATQYGYVLTNYHVIRPAVSVNVVLSGGDEGRAHAIVAEDESADLALLVVTVPASRPISTIPLSGEDPRVLATVYAIGSPKGLSGSASEGKVSGFRELPGETGQWLQTTAPISPGSSGGPLLLTDGTLVGVTTLIFTEGQNLNFAVPVSKVREFLSSKYHSREIAEGTSIEWHEYIAFLQMRVASESEASTYSDSEKEAAGLLQKAREQMREGRYDGAVTLVRRVESDLPNEFRYLAEYIMGKCSYHLAWEANKKEHGLTNINRARYETTKQADDAVRHLQRSIELKSDFTPALASLIHHYHSIEDWSEALAASNALINEMPRCAWAFNLRADCYLRSKQFEPAIKDLKAAIELGPNLGAPRFRLGCLLIDSGEYAAAIELLEAARKLKYSPGVVHFNLGRAYQKSGNFERAISEYVEAKETGFTADFMCDEEIANCQLQLR